MKKLLILFFLLSTALGAQIVAPQIPLTGTIGAGGPFALLNSGTLSFASDANHTMVNPEWSALNIKVTSTGALTATRSLITPNGRFSFIVENATTGGQSITVIGTSGTGVTIPNGQTASVWNDGTNYVQTGSSNGLSAISANSVLGNTTGGSAVPGSVSLPSCSSSMSALAYALGTGFSCNTLAGMALQSPSSVAITGGTGLFSSLGSTGVVYGLQVVSGASSVPSIFASTSIVYDKDPSGPQFFMSASGGAADYKNSRLACRGSAYGANSSACQFEFLNDALNVENVIWEVSRAGASGVAMYINVPLYSGGNNAGFLVCTANGANCPSGATPALSAITSAVASSTLTNGNNSQVWNWVLTGFGASGLALGETTASTGGGVNILGISTRSGSTAIPLMITQAGVTGSLANSALNIVSSWNTTGSPLAISLNVDITAAGAAAKLLDLSTTTSFVTHEQFNVGVTGNVFMAGALTLNALAGSVGDYLTIGSGGVVSHVSPPGGAVSSVFSRTGAVVAAANDYAFNQISGSITNSQLPTAISIVSLTASGTITQTGSGTNVFTGTIVSGNPGAGARTAINDFAASGQNSSATNTWSITNGDGHVRLDSGLISSDGAGNLSTTGLGATAIYLVATQTTTACSVAGSATFSEPFQGTSYKKVIYSVDGCQGSVTYTYPVAFLKTPAQISLAGGGNTVSTTSITWTSVSALTAIGVLEGW